MSVPLALTALAEQVNSYGDVAFLVTTSQDATPHVVSVSTGWRDGELVAGAGRHTSGNVEVNPSVTLLWPATPGSSYSLIVDGDGRVLAGEQVVTVRPTRAVLHRVAGADASLPSCVTVLDR